MKILKKIFVFLLGLFFTLLIFEIGLRLVYSEEPRIPSLGAQSAATNPNYTILFLGNSHTFGAGVDKKDAYPDVLQRFFNKNLEKSKYSVHVINAGKNTANTSEISAALDEQIKIHRPQLIHIMAGEPNYWNKTGMGDFLTEKYGYGLDLWTQMLLRASRYSKALKWIFSIEELSKKIVTSESIQNEIVVYKAITETEDHYVKILEKNAESESLIKNLNLFVEKNKLSPPDKIWRVVLYISSRYKYYLTDNQKEVVAQIKQSVDFKPDQFDLFSYYLINEILQAPNTTSETRNELALILKQLTERNAYPGLKTALQCGSYTFVSNSHAVPESELENILKICHDLLPAFALPAEGLNMYYSQIKQANLAHQAIIQTIQANPFARRSEIKKHFINILESRYATLDSKNKVKEIIKKFSEKYPSEAYLYKLDEDKKITEWISFDLEKISQKAIQSNATIVFQNYHWLRNKAEGNEINKTIENTAKELQLPFIDISTPFITTVKNSNDIESYFTQVFGQNDSHPSEKGHQLIAYLIYSELIRQKILPDELSHFNAQDILDGKY